MKLRFLTLCALLLLLHNILSSQSLSFDPPIIFDAGYNSNTLVAADFNNDGLMDIATANYGGDNVSILLAVKKDSFASEVLYAAGNGTFGIAAGDLNGDSNIDLVVTNNIDDNISVLLGVGDGTFSTNVNYAAINGPKGVVLGKFNADNFLDIAVANDLADKVSVYIGIGNGSFNAKVDYLTGDRPHDLLVGNFDNDSLLDLITVNRSDDNISLLKGNGNGTFQAKLDFGVGHFPEYATTGYFNSDSIIDIAVCNAWNYDSVSILLGDTNLIFKPKQNYYAGYKPYEAVAADFNMDSNIDLAITIAEYDSINILLGNGDGSFQMPYAIAAGNTPHGIISFDIEGDSDFDIINVNYQYGGSTYLYLNTACPKVSFTKTDNIILGGNNGSATAIVTGGLRPYSYSWNDQANQTDSTASNLSSGVYTVTIDDAQGCHVIADVEIMEPNCNLTASISKTNVSTKGGSDGQATVSPINGTPPYSFQWNDAAMQTSATATALSKGTYQVITIDSVGCKDSSEVIILELPCINESRYYSSIGANDVKICYINSDSILDVVTLHSVAYSTDKVNILFGNGDGSFTYYSSFTVGTGGDQPTSIEVNDFNGDSINDIIVAVPDGVNGISVYLGNGNGTFQTNVDYFLGSRPWDMVSSDFDQDGDMDLLICREQGNDVRMLKNNGNAVFSSIGSKSVGSNPMDIKAGYLNNDSVIDLVVVNRNQANMSILIGSSTYNFLSSVNYIVGLHPIEAALEDFNNDSITDIAVTCTSPDKLLIFIGNGDGTFQARVEYPAGNNSRGINALDMNNDSNIDLVLLNSSGNNLLVYLGEGNGVFDSIMMYPMNAPPISSAVADVDKDGDDDLIITMSSTDSIALFNNCSIDKCLFLEVDSIKPTDRNTNNGFVSISVIGQATPFSFQWNDSLQQTTADCDSLAAGTYKLIVTDSLGCKDSIEIIINKVECVIDTTLSSVSICQGDSVLFGGVYRKTTGQYRDSLINIYNCDSVNILNLTVNNITSNNISVSICGDYTVPSGDETYTISGVYQDTIPNSNNCDSIIIINLTVNQATSSSISESVCGSYTVPSGDETYTISGIYQDTIPNSNNCDSIIIINLTVNQATTSSISESVCGSYTVPSGDETYTISGVYQDTIPNSNNCDSIIIINLTVNQATTSSISETACGSYIVPSGDETYTISGIYQDTIPNSNNCDSIIIINLTVNQATTSSISETVCGSYTVPSGDETYTISGIYQDTIPNSNNCDSIIIINLTVNQATNSTISETVCGSYTVPSGDETYTISGIYQDTIPNSNNCDSIIIINLTVNQATNSTISETVCESYTVPSGDETYTISGIYHDTIPNSNNCDSIIMINLTVNIVDNSVTQFGDSLISNANLAAYQWLNCDNSFIELVGETNQIFIADTTGNYAVEVTQYNCIDTSVCNFILISNILENSFAEDFKVYPNPTSGKVNIEMGKFHETIYLKITDINGKIIQEDIYRNTKNIDLNLDAAKGVYFIILSDDINKAIIKIMKK